MTRDELIEELARREYYAAGGRYWDEQGDSYQNGYRKPIRKLLNDIDGLGLSICEKFIGDDGGPEYEELR